MTTEDQAAWGRADEDGTVYVREGDAERVVGQYPDATPAEALAYFERKFADLEGQVALVEQRIRGGAPAGDVAKAARHLRGSVEGASAVGDLQSLLTRLDALDSSVGELTEKQSEEQQAAVATALAEREQIVVEAETLAARDPQRTQWKQASAELDALFQRWQQHQKDGPRLPKAAGNDLWKRFHTARSTVETNRRAFFSELDAQHKDARQRKERIAERAEALAGRGTAAIPEYRQLLDEWKLAGRAGKKADDALWARFKAAGDVLYQAKAEEQAIEDASYAGNLEVKLALLEEAEALLKVTDRQQAKDKLLVIQRKWDAAGKVPRDQFRQVEDRLRKVETHVRKMDEEHWNRTDPEKQARSEGLAAQLTGAIEKLESELADAKASGDKRKIKDAEDALAARRIWLDAIG